MTNDYKPPPPLNPGSLPRVLTVHALDRYRYRVDAGASEQEAEDVLERGRYQPMLPGWLMARRNPGGVVVCPRCVFIVGVVKDELHAITCITKRRIPKADRRAHREHSRETRAEETA